MEIEEVITPEGRDQENSSFIAHISEDGIRFESVEEHLRAVSEVAACFAEPFGASSWARVVGMVHDAGKYSEAFQRRILHNGPKVDHSTAGAFELKGLAAGMLSYCVAGHHGGLPNGGTVVDDGGSLLGRLKLADRGGIPDYSAFRNRIQLPEVCLPTTFRVAPKTKEDGAFSLSFLTRMVFSCLVDADFLCTEKFMTGKPREGIEADSLPVLRDRLESHLKRFYPPSGKVNEARCEMLDDCRAASRKRPGVFSLTAPTGSGKTLGLLRFALNHACAPDSVVQRVICAIPYTSIIEQNAAVYRQVLGDNNVLEHHSSFDYDSAGSRDYEDPDSPLNRMKLAAENWDAPVVVTTNVQFFESLFASKTSRCRKLHNIANSVILLDEAQMIPVKFLLPCVKALAELVKNYGCTVVLCTATQPCLEGYFQREGLTVEEISRDPARLSKSLARVTYRSDGRLDDDQIASALLLHDQTLCIVNSRKQARCLFDRLASFDNEGIYHLTTMMHSVHRKRVLAQITQRLKEGKRCIVVATCLVEAGVDLDFPVVYRAVAGVDSLVQAAGRCNREGKRAVQESIVHLFIPAEPYSVPAGVGQRAQIAQSVLPGLLEGSDESLDVESWVAAYFNRLYLAKGESQLDEKSIVPRMSQNDPRNNNIAIFPFEDVGHDFKLIEEGSIPLVIPCEENEDVIDRARNGFLSRGDWRMLSRYSISLYEADVRSLDAAGAIEQLTPGVYVLLDKGFYRDDVGLGIAHAGGDALFF